MSKESIYSKRVDSFQGYLGFHGNISIKFPHKKWEKRKILQQFTEEILFCLNHWRITYDFLSSIHSNHETLSIIVSRNGMGKCIKITNNIVYPTQVPYPKKLTIFLLVHSLPTPMIFNEF